MKANNVVEFPKVKATPAMNFHEVFESNRLFGQLFRTNNELAISICKLALYALADSAYTANVTFQIEESLRYFKEVEKNFGTGDEEI
jgi:hypothetical protein